MSKVQEWQNLLAALGTLIGGLGGAGAIWKYLEHRQSLRKAGDDADDRLIGRYEAMAVRYEARIAALETLVEKKNEREVALLQTNAEYQMEIQMLRKQITALEKSQK
jgi:hypothetical protein